MARPRLAPTLLTVLAARPALAHPGHGLPGWLHHGEALVLGAIATAALVAWRRTARAGRRRDDR